MMGCDGAVRRGVRRAGLAVLLAGAAILGAAPAARADQTTLKLIQLLIQKGILTQGQAEDLLRQSGVPPRAIARGRKGAPALAGAATPVPAAGEAEAGAGADRSRIHVTYVPDFIRKQIADQVRADVMKQAEEEGYGSPSLVPDWPSRIRVYGDLRVRGEGDLFDRGNYNQFVNFNSINNGSPLDLNAQPFPLPPYLNTTADRDRFRIRARVGFASQIDDWISGDIRLATGNDNSPVSTNQTLGSPGDFDKYAIWLDRAYVKMAPAQNLAFYAGRMPNPFFTTDLVFDTDVNFDGFAAQYSHPIGGGFGGFVQGGAFPVFNTAFDFSTNQFEKSNSRDAWLFAIQGGADWKSRDNQYAAKLGIGFFDFAGVQGAVSDPCLSTPSGSSYTYLGCNTDNTRPAFLQFGNTLYPIRNIVVPANIGTAIPTDPQYFGLASRFEVLDVHPRFDILTYHPIDIELEGDFAKNFGFNRNEIEHHGPPGQEGPVNNNLLTVNGRNVFQGGDTAYLMKLTVGHLEIKKRWDWNVYLGYKYLESDAVLDALTDSDFHLGGTNAKGFLLGGSLGVGRNTSISARWYSTEQVSGPPYANDVIQVDLEAAF